MACVCRGKMVMQQITLSMLQACSLCCWCLIASRDCCCSCCRQWRCGASLDLQSVSACLWPPACLLLRAAAELLPMCGVATVLNLKSCGMIGAGHVSSTEAWQHEQALRHEPRVMHASSRWHLTRQHADAWAGVQDMVKPAFVFDGRNILDHDRLRSIGFIVYALGKPLDPFIQKIYS